MRTVWHDVMRVLHLAHHLEPHYTRFGEWGVYRGTSGWKDIVFDADIRTEPFHGVVVHKGLLSMYRESSAAKTPRFLGGYSCGGALAILHAIDVAAHNGTLPERILTVGTPRFVARRSLPGLRRLLRDTEVFQVYNPRDLVSKLPPQLCNYGRPIELEPSAARRGILYHHSSVTYAHSAYELLERHDVETKHTKQLCFERR